MLQAFGQFLGRIYLSAFRLISESIGPAHVLFLSDEIFYKACFYPVVL